VACHIAASDAVMSRAVLAIPVSSPHGSKSMFSEMSLFDRATALSCLHRVPKFRLYAPSRI